MDVARRGEEHRNLLRKGKHHSRKLQNAWNKYGESAFDFDLVDPVYDPDRLRQAESFWIDYYDSYRNGYNETTNTGVGTKIPAAVRARMSKGSLIAGRDPELRKLRSERAKAQHANGNLGRRTWKPSSEEGISDKLKQAWAKRRT